MCKFGLSVIVLNTKYHDHFHTKHHDHFHLSVNQTHQVHVDIDHPLVDISLDAFCNLWAVCSDGSAYFRMGISEEVPIGSRWMHIVKPDRDHLVRIAAGKYAVWALGATG